MSMASRDVDAKRHKALELLRPICISLMKNVSKQNVELLTTSLKEVDGNIIQEIQQYILFPVQHALHQKDLSDTILHCLCEGLCEVFSKSQVVTTQMFFNILNPLLFSVTSTDGSSKVSRLSEDTKISVVKAISSLLKAAREKVLNDFYTFKCLPAIGQLITVLLNIAEVEKSRSLQTSSLDCLLTLLQTGTPYGKRNEIQLGDMFAFCLPGVTMATCKIITGDSKQGHSVLTRAMTVWCRIVTLVMSDTLLAHCQGQQVEQEQQKVPEDELELKVRALAVTRNEAWVKTTASKLHVLIGRICKLVSSSNWRVRLSLAEMMEELLLSCSKSMNESVPTVLETLVGLINDNYGNVAKKAQNGLQTFAKCQAGSPGERSLIQILEENLYNLATSLPRQVKMCDEEDKPALVNLLNGYISLLGANIKCVVDSAPHLQRLSLALVQALEMDVSDVKLVEERASLLHQEPEIFTDTSPVHLWRPKKFFKHFRDEAILSGLLLACRQLGSYGNIYILVDHLLDVYQESALYRPAAILIINEMVVGAGCQAESGDGERTNNCQLVQEVVRMLLEEYLSSSNLQMVDDFSNSTSQPSSSSSSLLSSSLVVIKADQSAESRRNLINRNRAVLLICLFMEGVGKFASVLGEDFRIYLIQALYPLVENLGHENVHISSTAYSALVEVAVACSYTSLDSLMRDNADYLVSSVSLRLRHFEQNRRAPRTVCVMLRYCSHDLLPLIEHSLTQLLDSVDDHYTEDLLSFMPVLLELTTAVRRWFPSQKDTESQSGVAKTSETTKLHSVTTVNPQEVLAYITEHVRNKELAEGDFSDECVRGKEDGGKGERTMEDIEADMKKLMDEQKKKMVEEDDAENEGDKDKDGEDEEDKDEKKEAPKHVQLVKQVLQRIRNLLSSHDARLRVQALDVVCQGCHCLREYERELLPQIHQLWSGFTPLFHSQEKFIVVKAMQTLLVMCQVARDFLRQRVMKDIVPQLVTYMDKQANISRGSRSGYLHTGHYKLQLCVLSSLGPMAVQLGLDSNHLHQVAGICLPYLCDLQPAELQQASVESFSSFISLDEDAMWLMLCQSYCPLQLAVPGPEFTPVKFAQGLHQTSSVAANVNKIFTQFYS